VTAAPSLLYAPELGAAGSVLGLSREESHYVARVCRARPGDVVEATDGRGALARLRLASVGAEVRAEVVAVARAAPRRRTVLWCGAPERGRADWLVEKLAELGVARFQPLECRAASWPAGRARAERWKRLAIAALRQSRRTFLMEIAEPATVEEAIAAMERPATCWVGDPAGGPLARARAPRARPAQTETGAIGPSGGFEALERERLAAEGFVALRLADGRLRTETAAISLAAWWAGAGEAPGVDAAGLVP
jgi:16S rRNA (uracil1498-N3)-methyltransferase